MEIISQLIAATLEELFERGVIDWTLEDGAPESFEAECEIEYGLPVTTVIMCGFFVFLAWNWHGDDQWHAYHSMSTTFADCAVCEARFPIDEMRKIEGKWLCSGCASPIRNWVEVQQEMAVFAGKEVQVWH